MTGFISSDPLDNLTNLYQRPQCITANRPPTTLDLQPAMTQWMDESAAPALIYTTTGAGVWQLIGASSDLNTLTTDDSSVVSPTSGNINIFGGTGISTTGSGSTVTINGTGGGFEYVEVTGASQLMAVNVGYIANRGSAVTFTLPATAAQGDAVAIVGKGAGGWIIAQNAGQTIHQNSTDSTTGVGGSVASSAQYNCAYLVCITADTDWVIYDSQGILTFV